MLRFLRHSHQGFSILIALGSIGVLLIIMMSLAMIYYNETRLSRMQYNNIYAYAQAEGAFEYAMLKIANHRDGFQDSLRDSDIDSTILSGVTNRTSDFALSYQIDAQTRNYTGGLRSDEVQVFPLFVGTASTLPSSSQSLDPVYFTGIMKTTDLRINTGDQNKLSWSIVAMSGAETVSMVGTGNIEVSTNGTMRTRGIDCYNASGNKQSISGGVCPYGYDIEQLEYFYDQTGSVSDFLSSKTDPYLLVTASGNIDIKITANTPFTLPRLQVQTESRKGNSVQRIRFSEDKSKYYDALRYSLYNN